MPQKFSNKARSQLLAAISSASTSFSVAATDADLFPTADVDTGTLPSAPGDWFKAVIEDSNGYEIVYVRTRSAGSNVFSNVLRGQEGTTARSFPVGAVVGLRVTAQDAETAAKVPDLQTQVTGLASSKLDVAATSFGGNAATATRLQTPRTINGVPFDGSANITIADGTKLPLAGGTLTGKLTTAASAAGGAGLNLPHGAAPTTPSNGDVWTTTSGVFARVNGATKTVAFTDSPITGNAATATRLQTPRTLTIGNTGKSFDGSANVSWSLAEIGVVSASDTTQGLIELATTAEVQAGTDTARAVTPAGLAAYAGALSFRNKLINAAFTINQRNYTSGAATISANQYTLDRWRVVTSGQSLSWSGTAPNITITAPAGGVEQVIEGIWIEGGTYTLSWTGTATATVNGSAVTKGGQVTLAAGANATVRFSGGTVSKPQLELGPYATQFEHRPHGLELALCQRYYEILSVYQRAYAAAGAETLGAGYNFRVSKRAPPTITLSLAYSNASNGQVFDVTTNGFSLRANATSTGDAIYNGTATAVAEL